MSENTARQPTSQPLTPATIADVLQGLELMGDLSQFVIEDLPPEEEGEFFRILGDA